MENVDKKENPKMTLVVLISFILAVLCMIAGFKFVGSGFNEIYEKEKEKLKEYEKSMPSNYVAFSKYKKHSTAEYSRAFMDIELDSGVTFQIGEKYEDVLTDATVYIFNRAKKERYFVCFKNTIETKCYFSFYLNEISA